MLSFFAMLSLPLMFMGNVSPFVILAVVILVIFADFGTNH